MQLLRKHMPELDVLRGVAILAVILDHGLYWSGASAQSGSFAHLIIQATSAGWLGVNLFFVLSGFLITGILLDTKFSPTYYRRFYLNRACRILPAYFAMLILLLIFHLQDFKTTVVALFFLANYNEALGIMVSYAVFWSLAVEEQFYLIWPTVVRNTSVKTLAVIGCVLCVVEPLLRGLTASGRIHLGDAHTATYLIADNLAVGVLAAIFARSRYGSLQNGIKVGLAAAFAGFVILLAGMPYGILHRNNLVGNSLQTVPWNLIFAGVLLLLLGLRSSFFRGPWMAPLRFFGYVSYGLYLVHLLAFNLYQWMVAYVPNPAIRLRLQSPFIRLILEGGLAVLLAWLSRRFYEEPFLRRKAPAPDAVQTLQAEPA